MLSRFFCLEGQHFLYRTEKTARIKTGAGIVLLVLVCTFLQLVDRQGGMLGNILVSILTPAIGVVGTYVVDIILMIICVVIITGNPCHSRA